MISTWTDPLRRQALAVALLALALGACSKGPQAEPAPTEATDQPTNRIAVPELVRRNLGIEFVEVTRRRITNTVRVPGHFELLPSGRQEYRAQIPGRVELDVEPLQKVTEGQVLYRIHSPQWRTAQRQLQELTATVANANTRLTTMQPILDAHTEHEQSLVEAADVMRARIKQLEQIGTEVGGQAAKLAEARVQLAVTMSQVTEAREAHAEVVATIATLETTLDSDRNRLQLAIDEAAVVTGIPAEQLMAKGEATSWRRIEAIAVRATAEGVIEELAVTNGSFIETGDLVTKTVDPSRLWFHGQGLQTELPLFGDGLTARVVPADDPTTADFAEGQLHVGVDADPQQRTVDLYVRVAKLPGWARPGVAGFADIETSSTAPEVVAIPLSAVMQDGLQRVLFRRDSTDPDQVIRIEADLGADDGQWVEVLSDLTDGDQVVLDGAYELVLASSGSIPKGGHFHADGTWHAEDH